VWELDGLAEYDVRRRLTPTGTNLLGTVICVRVDVVVIGGHVFFFLKPTFERPSDSSW
jgi:hypothetical protein